MRQCRPFQQSWRGRCGKRGPDPRRRNARQRPDRLGFGPASRGIVAGEKDFLRMSSDQVARLAATIEVLTSAVQSLVAERAHDQPPELRADLLRVLQRSFSTPPRRDEALLGKPAIAQADLAVWM